MEVAREHPFGERGGAHSAGLLISMEYAEARTPEVHQLRERYLANAADPDTSREILDAVDQLLAVLAAAPDEEALRGIGLVRDLVGIVESAKSRPPSDPA